MAQRPKIITAKWKTALDSEEDRFGTIARDNEFQLTFPILHSFTDIPLGTTVLWGVTNKLKRCTALTLPFGPSGWVSRSIENNQSERLFNASSAIRHLLIGQKYLNDPTGYFVSRIAFTPLPNEDLRKPSLNSAATELFDNVLLSPGLTVSALVAGDLLSLCLHFESART